MSIKAILFDLGLTLIRTLSFPEIYKQILELFKISVSVDEIIVSQNKTALDCDTSSYEIKGRKQFWTTYNIRLLEKLGVEENKLFVASQIDELWWDYSGVHLYSDVESTLSKLKAKKLKIGLVSNGYKKDLDHVLGELDLEKWFDSIICIDSCNCAKPNKKIFLYALEDIGIQADEAIFVGDSIEYDYKGASKVGIKPYLIDRDGKIQGNYDKIGSLTELVALV
ncbi:HAD family hydrolase [Candidatus Bathyarchaeota archaeon]|nr:HAD family hydrolase [Candidatus Bathyarchaeota archaeon]